MAALVSTHLAYSLQLPLIACRVYIGHNQQSMSNKPTIDPYRLLNCVFHLICRHHLIMITNKPVYYLLLVFQLRTKANACLFIEAWTCI